MYVCVMVGRGGLQNKWGTKLALYRHTHQQATASTQWQSALPVHEQNYRVNPSFRKICPTTHLLTQSWLAKQERP